MCECMVTNTKRWPGSRVEYDLQGMFPLIVSRLLMVLLMLGEQSQKLNVERHSVPDLETTIHPFRVLLSSTASKQCSGGENGPSDH